MKDGTVKVACSKCLGKGTPKRFSKKLVIPDQPETRCDEEGRFIIHGTCDNCGELYSVPYKKVRVINDYSIYKIDLPYIEVKRT